MADKDFNSEQDNAYITALISKLRQIHGQSTDDEQPEEPPIAEEADKTTTVEPIAEEPADEDASEEPTDESAKESTYEIDEITGEMPSDTPGEDIPSEPLPAPDPADAAIDTVVPEEARVEETEEEVISESQPEHETEPAAEPYDEPAADLEDITEAEPVTAPGEEPTAPTPDPVLTEEIPAADTVAIADDAGSHAPSASTAAPATPSISAISATPARADASAPVSPAPMPTPDYARTVLPGDPRFTGRNTTGRFLAFDLPEEQETPPVTTPVAPTISAEDAVSPAEKEDTETVVFSMPAPTVPLVSPIPDSEDTPAVEEVENTPLSLFAEEDGAIPAHEEGTAPLPDSSMPAFPYPAERETLYRGSETGAPSPASDMPVPDATGDEPTAASSIWDSLFPLAGAEPTPDETQRAEDPASAVSPDAPAPSGLFGHRKAKKTFADCEFAPEGENNILTDKLLLPSPDLLETPNDEKQVSLWRQELRRRDLGARIAVIAVGVLCVLTALLELIPSFTAKMLSSMLLTRVPGAAHLIDLQFFLLAALFGAKQLYRGFAALRFRRIVPETVSSFAALFALGGSIYLTVADFGGKYFCCLPAVFLILCSLIGDLFRVRSARYAFDAYAAKGHHFCAVYSDVTKHPLVGREYADAENKNLLESAPIRKIEGFIESARRRTECRRASWISLASAGGAALIYLILCLIRHSDAMTTIWGMIVTFSSVLPPALFGVHRYFFHMLSARAAEERVGIAGEDTVYEYAKTGVMTFEDTEAFPAGSVQLSGIKLCGEFRLDRALCLVASVFDTVGGPLNGVFRVSTTDVNISDQVEIRTLYDDGIDATVNHDDVLIGTKAFLEARGVSVFHDVEDERAEQGRTRVLYLAYMGTLSAKFHLMYEMSGAFESNVEYYAKHGVASAILTADPLLSRSFVDRISYISEYDVRVVKKNVEALSEQTEQDREATLITYGPRKTLRRMPFFFAAYKKYQRAMVACMVALVAVLSVAVPFLLWGIQATTPLAAFIAQFVTVLPCVTLGFLVRRLNPNK